MSRNESRSDLFVVKAQNEKGGEFETISKCKYYPPVPYEELNDLLCRFACAFQKNAVVDTVMPSKILGMMASAKPSIVTGNEYSGETYLEISEGDFIFIKTQNFLK
jgi:colanic acid biosynthesis glycosyl transferase WcaI